MSARRQLESTEWSSPGEMAGPGGVASECTQLEVECLFRNQGQKNLVSPLRQVQTKVAGRKRPRLAGEEKSRAALALQEQWDAWRAQREQLRSDIRRGKECLEQAQQELARLRQHLEEWPTYERVCGHNPLTDYMQSLSAQERIAEFLPGWLNRQENQLLELTGKIERCAKEYGLEHLL